MLPTELPGYLDELSRTLSGARESADRAVTDLIARIFHHVPCNGDGSIRDLLSSDARAISRWLDTAATCAAALDYVQATAAARLNSPTHESAIIDWGAVLA